MNESTARRAGARSDLEHKIKVLNETVWEERVGEPTIRDWLDNFTGAFLEAEEERLHALFLLSNVTYFGVREIRALLRALFRDRYKYPLVRDIRIRHGNTTDHNLLNTLFEQELEHTRFVPLGDTAESGHMISYYFRQENGLSKSHFAGSDKLIVRRRQPSIIGRVLELLLPKRYFRARRHVRHVVFVDDFTGTGHQARQYAGGVVRSLRRIDPSIRTTYLVLATTQAALDYLKDKNVFDSVEAAVVLNDSDRCISPMSRIFKNPQVDGIDPAKALTIAREYGTLQLGRADALGYSGGGWLLSFNHNTPDNTLPIFWFDRNGWQWVLKRHHKY